MIDIRFVPLTQWPGKRTVGRKRSLFKSSWSQTLDLIDIELRRIGANNIIVQADFPQSQIRTDGWPYSKATPSTPGVILSFQSRKGIMSFPCDRYDDWKDNLRAIGLSLEALRAVDRYGVTQSAEQYRGWVALPPPENPFDVLARFSGFTKAQCVDNPDAAYREAAKRTHPDHGGSADQFRQVNEAKEQINARR